MAAVANSGGALISLKNKMQGLRDEMEKTKQQLDSKTLELEQERALRSKAEEDLQTLTKKLSMVEDEYEDAQNRLQQTNEKVIELGKCSDENERARRALESRQFMDDDRIVSLEQQVKEAKAACEDAENKFEEVARKLSLCETELERAEERATAAEAQVKQLDTELHVISSTLKSLEISESNATQKEGTYEETIVQLTEKLKDAEARSMEMDRQVNKLQKEVDTFEEELQTAREENKKLRDEFDAAYQEIQDI